MNKKFEALKAVQAAASIEEIQTALQSAEQPPSALFVQTRHEEAKKKGFRWFLLIMASCCICAVTYFAFIGGGYIAEYAGPIALIFGALDLTIVILLFADAVKGKLRLFLVLFEIASLLYLGYAMGGYFGGGNLRTAAEKKLAADYVVAKEHYTATQSTADLMRRAISNAASVAEVEARRDGKGVVFEKASFIASMKADSLSSLSTLPIVPEFSDLTAANKWLQTQRQLVAEKIARYDASSEAMKNQAKATEQSLREAMQMGLSQQQLSNLQVLAASMQEIANKEGVNSKLSDEILKPSDLKADGFQSLIGYIIDLVIIFFVLVLALQKASNGNIEAIKDQETKSLMEAILSEDGIVYDPEMVKDIPMAKQLDALKVVYSSEDLLKYLKSKISFDEYLQFAAKHPMLARKLGNTTWQLADIKKEIEKNPGFANYAEEAIKVTPSDWKNLNALVNNPEDFFLMEEDAREKFLRVLKMIQAKATLKSGELKAFISQFLLVENPTSEFMKTLEEFAIKLSTEKLTAITGDFVNNTTPTVAAYICANTENPRQFKRIVAGWNQTMNDNFRDVLSNGIVHEENFDQFMRCIINNAGIDGLKRFFKEYHQQKAKADGGGVGNKVLKLKPSFANIQTALNSGNSDDFYQEITDAIKVENSSVDY